MHACLRRKVRGEKLFSNKPGRKGSLAWEIKEVPAKGEDTGYPETGEASHIKTWTRFTMETQGN